MKLIPALVAAAFFATPLSAREVPFDVVVSGDSALVWSGAGENDYYPTQKLTRGDKARVVREGYGGWYMIEPPIGSHSWIRAKFVKRKGANKGITTENTVDRIGSLLDRSDLSIIHKVAEGEIVTILGKATMHSRSGSVEMLKIAPPRGEYRYINHRDVTPADDYTERPNLMASPQSHSPASPNSLISDSSSITDSNSEVATGPFGNPISIGSSDSSEVGPSVAEPAGPSAVGSNAFEINRAIGDSSQSTSTSGSPGFQTLSKLPDHLPDSARQGISMPGVHFEAPQPIGQASIPVEDRAAVENAWQNVMQTDGRFRQMLRQPVSQWNLGSLKISYTASADKLSSPSLKRQVENRIAAVDRYQKLYVDQIAIEQILSQTETRDAEIRQSYITKWHSVSTTNPPTTRILKPITVPGQPSAPSPAAHSAGSLTPTGNPAKFTGAGVVQRSALSRQGIPSYVLLAPDGRVLSYLQAGPGINLDQHIGKSVGITGPRGFRRELNADLMIVHGLTPVNLQP